MNLIEGIQQEQKRCQVLLEEYRALGRVGSFGAAVIVHSLEEGNKAIASGDVVAMARVLTVLREHQ